MEKIVDAKGQTCPIPIIMTKKALKEIDEGVVVTSVDNQISKENLEKMAKEMGLSFETKKEGDTFSVRITKEIENIPSENLDKKNTVVVISSDKMGEGMEELGKILMKGFIYTLTEMDELPSTILFYNSGARLTVEGSDSIEDLKILQENGTEILTCGTCLNFYGIQDKLSIGEVSNMYTIVEKQIKAEKIIRP
jgi:selenium metabolism protein YedF